MDMLSKAAMRNFVTIRYNRMIFDRRGYNNDRQYPMKTKSWTVSVASKKLPNVCKKLPNVCKSCPKMIAIEKLKILTPLQKLAKKLGNLG